MKRTVVVTGAAGGIGEAAVRAFVEAGWKVIAVDRKPIREAGDEVEVVQADISIDAGVARLFDRPSLIEAGLDALVNNAAVQLPGPAVDLSAQAWDETMTTNVRAAFLASQAAYPLLKAVGGCIVNIASVHALATSAEMAAYAASKGALVSLTRALALEFGPVGVRVNAVLPGAVETSMLQEGLKRGGPESASAARARLEERTPLGRVGLPEEIAQAILFLASPETSSFITGECLVVDGGAMARLSSE